MDEQKDDGCHREEGGYGYHDRDTNQERARYIICQGQNGAVEICRCQSIDDWLDCVSVEWSQLAQDVECVCNARATELEGIHYSQAQILFGP